MKIYVKIADTLLAKIRNDLYRPHGFAHERVGFLTAGATQEPDGIVVLCREYLPVADDDYERSRTVGAQIGSSAMRKALEAAYAHKSSLIHIHTHGGLGRPEFSRADLESAKQFVPGFFNALPRMPHGLIVLSNNKAAGLFWTSPRSAPQYVTGFIQIGAHVQKYGGRHEQA